MKTKLTLTVSLICLSTTLLTSPVFAQSSTPPPAATDTAQPPSTTKETPPTDTKPSTSATEEKSTTTEEKTATEEKNVPATPKKTVSLDNPPLEAAIKGYIETWQKQDLKAMYTYENWEGGNSLDEIGYIKAIDTNFKIHTWKISQVKPVNEQTDQYEVLIMVTHNPPAQVAALVPPGLTVRSTLHQWWKKQGDKYVHLFNIERQAVLGQMKQMAVPPTTQAQPSQPPSSAPPASKTEEKKEEKK